MIEEYFADDNNCAVKRQDVLRIGQEAVQYAREIIKKIPTDVQNNTLPRLYAKSLFDGMQRNKFSFWDNAIGIRDLIDDCKNPLDTGINEFLLFYEQVISVTSKYSIGNCGELVYQTLDYLLLKKLNIKAEVYTIENGNHQILVLNRDVNSNPSDPATWGDNAVICDPWANKVYPAQEYRDQLKAVSVKFNYDRFLINNELEDFNHQKHSLILAEGHDVDIINKLNIDNIPKLQDNFKKEQTRLLSIIEDYKYNLEIESNRIQSKYGNLDKKMQVIHAKIQQINSQFSEIKANIDKSTLEILQKSEKMNFREQRALLTETLNNTRVLLAEAMKFSKEDLACLFDHREDGVKKYFGLKCDTEINIERITSVANHSFKL